MNRVCSWCDELFDAQSTRARYCSDAHRAAAFRARAEAPSLPAPVMLPGRVRVEVATLLRKRGIGPSHELHSVAIAVADRFDDPDTPTSALSSVYDAMRHVLTLLEQETNR